MNVAAFDPGGTTGIAIHMDNSAGHQYGRIITTCATQDYEIAWRMAAQPGIDVIVVERFITSGRIDKHGLQTIEIVGGLKSIATTHNKKIVVHLPQNRYSCQTMAHQHLVNSGVPFVIHEEDALAHLMYYLETGR